MVRMAFGLNGARRAVSLQRDTLELLERLGDTLYVQARVLDSPATHLLREMRDEAKQLCAEANRLLELIDEQAQT